MNRGVVMGATAYVLWGISPIYWRTVDAVAALDIIVHRVLMTALFLVAIHVAVGSFARVRSLVAQPRARWMFVLTAALLATNWLVFVWAVNDDRVLEASLGYFINPLVSVVLGVVFLDERLRRGSLVAVMVATVGVLVLTVDVGRAPWVSLTIGGTFALYGLIRKTSPAGSLDGLTLEMFALFPCALLILVARTSAGDGASSPSPGSSTCGCWAPAW